MKSFSALLLLVDRLLLRVPLFDHVFRRQRNLRAARVLDEDALQRVVILLRNRIELVVVALRAGHRQAEEAARGRIHAIVLHLRAQRVEAQARAGIPADRRTGSRSPAICAFTNRSYGMSWLNAWITQSR